MSHGASSSSVEHMSSFDPVFEMSLRVSSIEAVVVIIVLRVGGRLPAGSCPPAAGRNTLRRTELNCLRRFELNGLGLPLTTPVPVEGPKKQSVWAGARGMF